MNASLIILANSIDQNLAHCTYLLNLINKKLNVINVKLVQVFIVTDRLQLIEQLKHATDSSKDWTIITGADSNVSLMSELVNNNNNGINYESVDLFHTNHPVAVIDRRVFFIERQCFQVSLATCLKYIVKSQSKRIGFRDRKSFEGFVDRVNEKLKLSVEKLGMDSDFESSELSIRHGFSNYCGSFVEVDTGDLSVLEMARKCGCVDFFEDNIVNADFYVYEFLECPSFWNGASDEPDIRYLSKKIDQNSFIAKLKSTIQIIEQTFAQYTPSEICISFNGGKDCCIVLFLLYAVALRLGIKLPLHALLIQIPNQFKEMTDYVHSLVTSTYTKQIIEFIVFSDSKTMKNSLQELRVSRPEIKAILIGTRRSDGEYFKNLEAFAYTDGDWPRYMRVNPILDWTYSEVWYFMRVLKLPYCSLYDQGYTSIDNSLNTVPNKELLNDNGVGYLPAWRLENGASERYSRKKLS